MRKNRGQEIDMPKVSVIMAVYNGGGFLRPCLDSFVAQSFRDFEFLVMDDGSMDDTATILNEYASQDGRFKCFRQENKGLAVALNTLIGKSVGEYIARMDVDDLVSPERLAEQVAYLDAHPDVNLVTSGVAHFLKNGRLIFAVCPKERSSKADEDILCGRRNTLVHGSVMLRSKALKEFPMPYRTRYGQDYDLWIRCLSKGWKFATIPRILYFYRKGSALQENDAKNAIRDGQRKAAVALLSEGRLFDDEYCLTAFAKIAEDVRGRKRKSRLSFVVKRWAYDMFSKYIWLLHPECVRAKVYDVLFARRGADYLKYYELKKLVLPAFWKSVDGLKGIAIVCIAFEYVAATSQNMISAG